MRIEFADAKLERLASDVRYTHGLGPDAVRRIGRRWVFSVSAVTSAISG